MGILANARFVLAGMWLKTLLVKSQTPCGWPMKERGAEIRARRLGLLVYGRNLTKKETSECGSG